jgi:hypothetical protein
MDSSTGPLVRARQAGVTPPVRAVARGRLRARRVLAMVAWAVAAAAAFAVYLRLASSRAVNSDGASQALQAWDLLHGNVLLRGWMLTDVSFYTTEIPEYLLVELARGLGPDVVRVAAAVTYTLAVAGAALLAKGTAAGRAAVLRMTLAAGIMLAPQLGAGTDVLLSSPDHIGTSVPVLATWLILDRARPRWWVPVVTSVLLAWSLVGDQLVLVVAILPLIGVCAVRVARVLIGQRRVGFAARDALVIRGSVIGVVVWRAAWYEATLAAGAIAAGIVGTAVPHVPIRGSRTSNADGNTPQAMTTAGGNEPYRHRRTSVGSRTVVRRPQTR